MNQKTTYAQAKDIDGMSLMRQIIAQLVSKSTGYPDFDYMNNVLTSPKLPEDTKLWLHFGIIRVVRKGQTVSGEMDILTDFQYDEEDGFKLFTSSPEVEA